jgi:hypothetical protein
VDDPHDWQSDHAPAQRFLVALLRCDATAASCRDAASSVDSWPSVLAQARRHGVLPTTCGRLRTLGNGIAPPEIVAELRTHYLANARRGSRLLALQLRAVTALARDGVPAIALKGPAFAEAAYGDVALRHFVDVDILVRRSNAVRAFAVLDEAGFTWRPPVPVLTPRAALGYNSQATFRAGNSDAVELHWGLVDDFGAAWDIDALVASAADTTLAGKPVRTPQPIDMLPYLAYHAAHHGWEHLRLLLDVALLLSTAGPWDWDAVLAGATRRHVRRITLLAVDLAADVLGAPVPEAVRAAALADPLLRAARAQALRALFVQAPGVHSTATMLRASRLLADHPAHLVLPILRRACLPSEAELSGWPLPPAWRWLYWALRPVRVLGRSLR